ncbi:MAG: efflux RND transporter permease subunit [Verrucomicrobia bacterium]|nr:efflux RND transporter permease subunit [Verrucomicrobiota bacterium]MCG2679270.1 efflux RND transporter permease subunit [Kiritimatiellia bacterium]MBU4247754.1 efflux RND transporter permease subunit [Verrucomicrobiota bacterium]MBU4290961.1 efflux RND transporter permease subunit [Verrucomicrobiota bacterium]MBU4430296.1 efflux RND transporter permease subunit [Verrucomicrobiota bacterium]
MTFSEIFIRRPIMTTLVMAVMAVFGVWSYFRLPVNSLPTVDYPVIQVTVAYPGASPATMASAVATPLENQFTQINGLQSMISDNKEGISTINLTFSLDRNVDLVAPDVQAAITRAQNNLPKDLPNPPTYKKYNPSDSPIYFLMLYSDTLSHGDLYDYANHIISKKLSMIEGVSQVQTFGAQRAVRIQFIPEQLAAYQIGIDELALALKAGTVNIPGGSLNGPSRTFSLEPQGQLRTGREFGELIIAYRDNAPVRLKDVAHCVDSVTDDLVDIRYQKPGLPEKSMCVVMAISRVSGANTVAVAAKISQTLATARRELPQSINYETMFNGAQPIKESIEDVQETVVIALVLVVLVMFMFLGRIRETIIPGIVLPISLLGTLILMLVSKFSIDTLSLMGIVLAVGFLVDDAIVVLENTVRHMEAGMKPIPAAIQSMKEITFTVISTSVALIIVFTPLVFMSGAVGRNLREFALTVIYAVIVSTVVALTLSPMMCARIIKHSRAPNRAQRLITDAIAGLVRQYGKALTWTLRHKYVSLIAWVVCIAGTVWLFMILPQSFLPKGDSSFIHGAMLMPQGASTAQMQAFQKQAMAIISEEPDVIQLGSVTGFQPGADQSLGFLFIRLRPPHERKYPIEYYTQKLMGRLMVLPSGFCYLQAMPVLKISSGAESTAVGSDYAYLLMGLDRDKVYATSRQLEMAMRGVPGFFSVQNNIKLTMPRLNMTIARDRASALGITAETIEIALALGYAGGYVTQFTTDLDQYQVIPEIEKEHQRLPSDLAMLYLRSPVNGTLVPLKSVVDWKEEAGPQNVPHAQQQESATLSFSIAPGIPLGYAIKKMEEVAAKILPAGVVGKFTGDAQEFKRSIASLGILLLVAIFLKYIMLGILYESYIHPFTILTTLPVAVFGGLLTLLAFGSELSIYGYIGMFVLIGLITKNGILMVDFAEQRRAEGMNSYDAIYDACLVRFRPILMTGLCAILGTMPIALGYGADASSRIPLGLVVVGGMVFAQIITLFVTPGIFLYMDRIQERFFKPRADLE